MGKFLDLAMKAQDPHEPYRSMWVDLQDEREAAEKALTDTQSQIESLKATVYPQKRRIDNLSELIKALWPFTGEEDE